MRRRSDGADSHLRRSKSGVNLRNESGRSFCAPTLRLFVLRALSSLESFHFAPAADWPAQISLRGALVGRSARAAGLLLWAGRSGGRDEQEADGNWPPIDSISARRIPRAPQAESERAASSEQQPPAPSGRPARQMGKWANGRAREREKERAAPSSRSLICKFRSAGRAGQ